MPEMTAARALEILRRKTSIPMEGETFDEISMAYDKAISVLEELAGKERARTVCGDAASDGQAGELKEYSVRIVLDELTIFAYDQESAEQIAQEIYDADAHTQLHYGLSVVGYDTECHGAAGPDEEPTEID